MIKVLIADDHPIVRQGLRQILASTADMEVAGEAVNSQEALDQGRVGGWDVLVLDITMPGCRGFDILKELKHEQPDLPVLSTYRACLMEKLNLKTNAELVRYALEHGLIE
jgi:DNA-binding NarL/FixJ family response regulator